MARSKLDEFVERWSKVNVEKARILSVRFRYFE